MPRRPKDVYGSEPDAAYHSHHELEDLAPYLDKITDLAQFLSKESDPQIFLPVLAEAIKLLQKIQQLAAEISMETHKLIQEKVAELLDVSNGTVFSYRHPPLKLQDLEE